MLMAQRQAAGRYGLISSPMVPRFSRSMPCPYRLTHHCHRHPLYAHGGGSALDWQLEWHGVAKARVCGRGAGASSAPWCRLRLLAGRQRFDCLSSFFFSFLSALLTILLFVVL